MKSITENTLVPIGLAFLVIGGGAMWVNDITNKVKFNKDIVDEMHQSLDATQKLIYEVNSRLSKIEWKLDEDSQKFSRRK